MTTFANTTDVFLNINSPLSNGLKNNFSNESSPDLSSNNESRVLGFIAMTTTGIFFGSNYLPVKRYHTGDGLFFQWVQCAGIWSIGLFVQVIRGFPKLYALPVLGGILWCLGNLCSVPVINGIGMAKGLLLWSNFGLITGWATSRYGLFGLRVQRPKVEWMNYCGVFLCVFSTCFYILIKPNQNDKENLQNIETKNLKDESKENNEIKSYNFLGFSFDPKKLCVIIAILMGCSYGTTFIPSIYAKENYEDISQNSLDYVFNHFTGIFITSTLSFMVYCIIKNNKPYINPSVALPGFVSGLLWGIACAFWFYGNDFFSPAITYPFAATLPGVVSSIWGILLMEIRGKENFIILSIAISLGLLGTTLTGISR